jgi:peroxiredoxin
MSLTSPKMNNSVVIALTLTASIALSPVSIANAVQDSTHTIKMSSFNLNSQKWQNRVLLLFAPSVNNHSYQQQMQLFNQQQNDFKDRDLVLVQVLATDKSYANGQLIDESSASNLRNRFGVDKENFRVILIGKDGGVKRQETTPVQATAIFEQIDAMPMRQQEMQER